MTKFFIRRHETRGRELRGQVVIQVEDGDQAVARFRAQQRHIEIMKMKDIDMIKHARQMDRVWAGNR